MTTIIFVSVTIIMVALAAWTANRMKSEGYNQETYTNQVCGNGNF